MDTFSLAPNKKLINLHAITAKQQGTLTFKSLSSISDPVIGVDYLPPMTANLRLPTMAKKISDKALKFTGDTSAVTLPSYFCWSDDASVKAAFGTTKPSIAPYVRNQAGCGICWAFAVATAFTDRWLIATGDASFSTQKQFSPAWIAASMYNDTCPTTNAQGCCYCDGGITMMAHQYLKTGGTTLESCLPFNESVTSSNPPTGGFKARPTSCPGGSVVYKARDWGVITKPEDMKREIYTNGPIVGGMMIFNNFMTPTAKVNDWSKSGVYIHDPNDVDVAGGHAIVIMGWGECPDPSNPSTVIKYWICRNTWTTRWNPYNYVDSPYTSTKKLALPGYFKIAISGGSNCGLCSINSDIYLDSNNYLGGATWALPDLNSPTPFGQTCTSSTGCQVGQTCTKGTCAPTVYTTNSIFDNIPGIEFIQQYKTQIIALSVILFLIVTIGVIWKRR